MLLDPVDQTNHPDYAGWTYRPIIASGGRKRTHRGKENRGPHPLRQEIKFDDNEDVDRDLFQEQDSGEENKEPPREESPPRRAPPPRRHLPLPPTCAFTFQARPLGFEAETGVSLPRIPDLPVPNPPPYHRRRALSDLNPSAPPFVPSGPPNSQASSSSSSTPSFPLPVLTRPRQPSLFGQEGWPRRILPLPVCQVPVSQRIFYDSGLRSERGWRAWDRPTAPSGHADPDAAERRRAIFREMRQSLAKTRQMVEEYRRRGLYGQTGGEIAVEEPNSERPPEKDIFRNAEANDEDPSPESHPSRSENPPSGS